ncbi:serine/threonine-protein kinase [Kribbella sp. NPDC048915]|uniref:serine/threonine-protein kinase n=1 Tax=Kribbella sp. NPDC048915 TaxID=3155148 RepID=UPI0034030F23
MTTQQDPAAVGPFAIQGRLGRGAMGAVYLARSPGGRLVAVKVVRDELAGDSGFRTRFAREIDAARRVSGAFTAAVVDADPSADPPWLATEYLPGPTLEKAISTSGPLAAGAVRSLAGGLAEALAAIHASGLVHRDLKPSNIVLSGNGPRVIDFGIARALEEASLTATRMVVGTPGYLSPEQITGGAVGPASDVFALGAVLVFAASGRGPFASGSPASLLHRVVNEPPYLPSLPAPLHDVVRRCLTADPTQRPSPSEILQILGPANPPTLLLPPTTTLPAPTKLLPPEPGRRSAEVPPGVGIGEVPPGAGFGSGSSGSGLGHGPGGVANSRMPVGADGGDPPAGSGAGKVPPGGEFGWAPAVSGSAQQVAPGMGFGPVAPGAGLGPVAPGHGVWGGSGGAVFVTSRGRSLVGALVCTALWLGFMPVDPQVKAMHPVLSSLSAVASLVFLWFAVRYWILALRPKVVLRLSVEGVTVERAGRRATVPWYGVTRVRIGGERKRPWLVAWLEPQYQNQLPVSRKHHGGLRLYPIGHGASEKRRRLQGNELHAALNWYAGPRYDRSY